MPEKYDFEIAAKYKKFPIVIHKDGWAIVIEKMFERGTTCYEYPPSPEFYKIVKRFYPNGMLKAKGKALSDGFGIDIWNFYDEDGNITERVDMSEKFRSSRIKIKDILAFLDKEGHIDLKTGEGREYIFEGENYNHTVPCHFSLNFINNGKGESYWYIMIEAAEWNNYYETIYHLDKDTGKVLKKETKKVELEI